MCVVVINAQLGIVATIRVGNGQKWGNWNKPEFCKEGQYAYAYSMKIERMQGRGDDTSLNGIQLYCGTSNATSAFQTITSGVGPWGEWQVPTKCRRGEYLTAFSLQVESEQGAGDDTAANYVKFLCRGVSGEYEISQSPGHGFWGNFGPWSFSCPKGSAICGLSTKLENPQGQGDDTALNNVFFFCCKF